MKVRFTLNVSMQAIVTLVSLLIVALFPVLIAAFYSPAFLASNLSTLLAGAIVILLVLGIRVYETNCFVYGGCGLHAWIVTAVTVAGTLAYCWYLVHNARKIEWESQNATQTLEESVRNGINNTKVLNKLIAQ